MSIKGFKFNYPQKLNNSYTGDSCNRKIFDSEIFQNSNILTQEQSVSLIQVLKPFANISFSLIYQASRDGFSLSDFHSKCDGTLNTLTIIKTTSSLNSKSLKISQLKKRMI